ncbi:formate dehydrogenase accessory sulfurtransferase FdhD [Ochrobactrum sp. POC9]|nr:formate dehydrogenase accessory sulfurtransferase FdhD [Ochrobactrum sp. POC9]PWU70874.1 formate dehydrogenase accessory sulfurtransferase FdhD [Ochrobactrum sp. POC9]
MSAPENCPGNGNQSTDFLDFTVREVSFEKGKSRKITRPVPIEAPVAFEICGFGYAVMMATPTDLEDFALGFLLSERLVSRKDQIEDILIHPTEGGWIVRIELGSAKRQQIFERARKRVSESSCGLCGLENIQQVLRQLSSVGARIDTDRSAIFAALHHLREHQPLGNRTGAAHAAAFCGSDGKIICVREDVGRHNALDKLIGAITTRNVCASTGFILLSARCSYELVEKTVHAGCPMLVTISAPTSLAIERAKSAGLTLVSLARSDSALIVCDPRGSIRDACEPASISE